jgi:hypothetical protein
MPISSPKLMLDRVDLQRLRAVIILLRKCLEAEVATTGEPSEIRVFNTGPMEIPQEEKELAKLLNSMSTLLVRSNEVVSVSTNIPPELWSAKRCPPTSLSGPGESDSRSQINFFTTVNPRRSKQKTDRRDAMTFQGHGKKAVHILPPSKSTLDINDPMPFIRDIWYEIYILNQRRNPKIY